MKEWDVKGSGLWINGRYRELNGILRKRRIRISPGCEDRLHRPCCAAINRTAEPELRSSSGRGLKARPRDVNVVSTANHRISSDGEPLFISSIVLLNDNRVAPGGASVGGLIHLYREPVLRIPSQTGVVEVAAAIGVDDWITEGKDTSRDRRNEAADPASTSIGGVGES